jgi:hypothetical protein
MNDKIIAALLAVLIALGGWTLSRTFSLSQDMVLVKEKVTQIEEDLDTAVRDSRANKNKKKKRKKKKKQD